MRDSRCGMRRQKKGSRKVGPNAEPPISDEDENGARSIRTAKIHRAIRRNQRLTARGNSMPPFASYGRVLLA